MTRKSLTCWFYSHGGIDYGYHKGCIWSRLEDADKAKVRDVAKDYILRDVWEHTSRELAKLMASKKFITDLGMNNQHPRFRVPGSQYMLILASDEVKILACDPDINAFVWNMHQMNKPDLWRKPMDNMELKAE